MANAPCVFEGRPAGLEPATYCIHSAALCPLSYGQRVKVWQGWRGSNPQSLRGRLFEGQAALSICIHPRGFKEGFWVLGSGCWLKPKPSTWNPTPLEVGRDDPSRTGMCPFDGNAGLEPAALPLCYAPANTRGETRTLTEHVLSMPPLPAWATRAREARGGSRTRTETLFERATSAVWVTRARL